MISRAIVVICAVTSITCCFGQSLTDAQKQELATFRLYSEFFSRVKTVDMLADRDAAKGKDPLHTTRRMIQNDAQLTDSEYQAVRAIAQDCHAKVNANWNQQRSVGQTLRSQPSASALTDQLTVQLGAMR